MVHRRWQSVRASPLMRTHFAADALGLNTHGTEHDCGYRSATWPEAGHCRREFEIAEAAYRSCPRIHQQELRVAGRSTRRVAKVLHGTWPESWRKALAVLLTTFRNCRTTAEGSPRRDARFNMTFN